MRPVTLPLAFALALWAVWTAPLRAQAADQPIIESIEGDKIVVIKTASGSKVGYRGTPVNVGDRVKTGPRASAKVLYPDGSKLLIGRATEVEIQESSHGQQFNELRSGEVRGIIKKAADPKGPPRFIIRSRSAVMGVRGTDFVFNLDEATAKNELRTLDGAVEVARDEQSLMEGKGVMVRRDEMVSADAQALRPPEKFDRRLYDQLLEAAQPQMMAMARRDPEIVARAQSVEAAEDAHADEAPKRARLRLLDFQLGGVYMRQKSGGDLGTLQATWTPVFELLRGVAGVRLNLGILPLKSRTRAESKTFIAKEISLLGSVWLLEPLVLEAGIGGQDWGHYGPGGPMGTAQVAWLRNGGQDLIERWYVGVSVFDQDRGGYAGPDGRYDQRNLSVLLRAGVGVQF